LASTDDTMEFKFDHLPFKKTNIFKRITEGPQSPTPKDNDLRHRKFRLEFHTEKTNKSATVYFESTGLPSWHGQIIVRSEQL